MKQFKEYFKEAVQNNKVIGYLGLTNEEGLVYCNITYKQAGSDGKSQLHSSLTSYDKGYNQGRVIGHHYVFQWRYSKKSHTLFYWPGELSTRRFDEFKEKTINYIETRLHRKVQQCKIIQYDEPSFYAAHMFESLEHKQKPLGIIGYATEDGIAYMIAYDLSDDHQLLMSSKITPKGPNAIKVKASIKHALNTNDGMRTDELIGFRYSLKHKTLFIWFNYQVDPFLREYLENYLSERLHLPINNVKDINHYTNSYRAAHFQESVDYNKIIGYVGYTTEDGIAYIRANSKDAGHADLLSRDKAALGINTDIVIKSIFQNLPSCGWRYVLKNNTLYIWNKGEYIHLEEKTIRFLEDRLHVPINDIKIILIGNNFTEKDKETAHNFGIA